MNDDLALLLDRATPEPPSLLDPDTVLLLARGRRRKWTMAAAAAAAVLAVTAPLAVLRATGSPDALPLADVPVVISALERRQPLPPLAVTGTELTGTDGVPLAHPGEGTLVASTFESDVWLAATVDDHVCYFVVSTRGGGYGSECWPRRELLTRGLSSAGGTIAADVVTFVAVVPDGYTAASIGGARVRVEDNVAVVTGPFHEGDELHLTGPGVPAVTQDPALAPEAPARPGARWGGAQLVLDATQRSAQRYARERGSTAGFAKAFLGGEGGALHGQFRVLTDDLAVVELIGGRCYRLDLPDGRTESSGCAG